MLVGSTTLVGQTELEGLWEGTLSIGGLDTNRGYPVQIYIVRKGRQLTARTYISIAPNRIIEMEAQGWLYSDNSVAFNEATYIPKANDGYTPPYMRKYQLLWHRSIGGSTLTGYWQEIHDEVFHHKRAGGRISLKKVTTNKA